MKVAKIKLHGFEVNFYGPEKTGLMHGCRDSWVGRAENEIKALEMATVNKPHRGDWTEQGPGFRIEIIRNFR